MQSCERKSKWYMYSRHNPVNGLRMRMSVKAMKLYTARVCSQNPRQGRVSISNKRRGHCTRGNYRL
jgi:hypothetical protein